MTTQMTPISPPRFVDPWTRYQNLEKMGGVMEALAPPSFMAPSENITPKQFTLPTTPAAPLRQITSHSYIQDMIESDDVDLEPRTLFEDDSEYYPEPHILDEQWSRYWDLQWEQELDAFHKDELDAENMGE